MLKTSFGRLNAIDTIHKSGTIVMKARTALTIRRTIRVGLAAALPSKVEAAGAMAASAIDEAASAGEQEEDHRHRHQDQDEDRGHRGGVAEIVVLKGLLVDVIDRELRRVRRPALRHDVDQVEGLETADSGDRRNEQDEEAR